MSLFYKRILKKTTCFSIRKENVCVNRGNPDFLLSFLYHREVFLRSMIILSLIQLYTSLDVTKLDISY